MRSCHIRAYAGYLISLVNCHCTTINFHDGAVVANYPWDDKDTRPWEKSPLFRAPDAGHNPNYTPDHKEFLSLAENYAAEHSSMTRAGCGGEAFPRGVTNGVDWYIVEGGMQDFNYLYTNAMELTLELSTVKKPEERQLQGEWEGNKESLISFLGLTKSSVVLLTFHLCLFRESKNCRERHSDGLGREPCRRSCGEGQPKK